MRKHTDKISRFRLITSFKPYRSHLCRRNRNTDLDLSAVAVKTRRSRASPSVIMGINEGGTDIVQASDCIKRKLFQCIIKPIRHLAASILTGSVSERLEIANMLNGGWSSDSHFHWNDFILLSLRFCLSNLCVCFACACVKCKCVRLCCASEFRQFQLYSNAFIQQHERET